MGLKDIDWKSRYDSKINNITTEFFIPALHESTSYRRIAGLFSSTSFALCARGLKELIVNNGTMQLIISPILTKEDTQALKESQNEKIIEKSIKLELNKIETEFEKNHVAALQYLLKQGILEIRVDIPKDTDGKPLDVDSIIEKNLLAEKRGIFQDRDGNALSFRGPINETRESWERGMFSITVDQGWIAGQEEHVLDDNMIFDNIWNDKDTLPLPQGIKDELTKTAPTKDEIDLDKFNVPSWAILPDGKILWPNQIRAVNAWINSNYKGIFSIATAGGKTLAALVSANLSPKNMLALIIAPGKTLVKQWEEEIRTFESKAMGSIRLVICDSGHPWRRILPGMLVTYMKGVSVDPPRSRLYIIATPQTASSEIFQKYFKNVDAKNVIIIGDEVHHLGAPEFSNVFDLPSSRRIGLSATFERTWDEIGTQDIVNYFGRELNEAEYGICEGIKEGRLCKYRYLPFFAFLDRHETQDYMTYTKSIGRIVAQIEKLRKKGKRDQKLEGQLRRLLERRSDILKTATDKIRVYKKIISSKPPKPYVVFMDDNAQIKQIKKAHVEEIRDLNANFGVNENPAINIFSGEMKEFQREEVIKDALRSNTPIFAMQCLDEGISLPELQSAILISSTTSTRQYIQRRGRILRAKDKNKIANLYDIIVLPSPTQNNQENRLIENAVRSEQRRVEELASCAENKWEVIHKFEEEIVKLGFALR